MKYIKLITILVLVLLILKSMTPYYEGAQVLYHYIFGNGKDFELKSTYIEKSNIILNNLNDMSVGETRKVSFKQEKDWRLSYAINGFNLTKTNRGFYIYQYIKFDSTGKVFTEINTYFGKIKALDSWVHIFNCAPFNLYFKYEVGKP